MCTITIVEVETAFKSDVKSVLSLCTKGTGHKMLHRCVRIEHFLELTSDPTVRIWHLS